MGSKSRIAKHIVPILHEVMYKNNIDTYIEPFVGGANVIDKIKANKKFGGDLNKYLIELFLHIINGGELPDNISREEYSKVRANKDAFPDWYVGCVGFLASYNGRFFDGGYAQPGYEKTKGGERYRDYYNEAKRNLLAQVKNLKDIKFFIDDYKNLSPQGSLIYCDPPYKNTKEYANSKSINYDEFWETMRKWSQDNIVVVSELDAPDDFECIWEQEVSRSIKSTDKSRAVEKLFTYKST